MEIKQKVQTTKTVKKKSKFDIGDIVSFTGFHGDDDVVITKIIYIHLDSDGDFSYKLDGITDRYIENKLTKQS